MVEISRENMAKIAPLFEGWEDTLIQSCFAGMMGRAWADNLERPAAAQIAVGDFGFLAGTPNPDLAGERPFLVVPRTPDWNEVIEAAHPGHATRFQRYAVGRPERGFDRARLAAFAGSLPEGYAFRRIGRDLFASLSGEAWSEDFVSQFADAEDYARRGLGFVVMCEGVPVAGASSYAVFPGGIEIEVDTAEAHRRRGLARAVCAKLILACLDLGLKPGWDASSMISVALAEHLGYHLIAPYDTYAIR